MTVIKTFILPGNTENEVKESSVLISKEESIDSKPKEPNVESLLLAMPKEERDSMLTRLFKKDLNSIIELEAKKGFDTGYSNGVEKSKLIIEKEMEKQNQEFEDELLGLNTLLEALNTSKKEIFIDKSEDLIEILNIALFRLLGEKVESGSYLKTLLLEVAQEFSYDKSLTLNLSSYDHNLVKKSLEKNECSLINKLNILEDKNISPGSFRIAIKSGDISSDLNEKLSCLLADFEKRQKALTL